MHILDEHIGTIMNLSIYIVYKEVYINIENYKLF